MSKECGSSSCRWREKLYIAAEMRSRARSREGSAKMAILISFAQVASKLKIMLKHHDLVSLLDLGASVARLQACRGSEICPFMHLPIADHLSKFSPAPHSGIIRTYPHPSPASFAPRSDYLRPNRPSRSRQRSAASPPLFASMLPSLDNH